MGLLYATLAGLLASVVVLSSGYLLLILGAAVVARRTRASFRSGEPSLRLGVVIPAHDEELVLSATLESLKAQDYPADRFEIVVVADNCTDATASIARGCGARVMERVDPVRRGKGYALDWAFSQLLAEPTCADAYVIVDADTWVSPEFLRVMAARLDAEQDADGCCALQGRYGVLNRQDGWRAVLMGAAFDLVNHVRLLGADRLGFSVGLKGNGMAFTRAVLARAPWQGRSITEDIDYGLDLLRDHGIRVGYVPEAKVLAQMPITAAQAESQRERWEKGRYGLLRERALPLFWEGLRKRDVRLCEAGAALLVPPLAELCGLLGLWGAVIAGGHATGLLAGSIYWYGAFAFATCGLFTYVVGGLRVAEAPRSAYLALLKAPVYAGWKFVLYGAGLLRRSGRSGAAQSEWVRTARVAIPAGQNGEPPAGSGEPTV